MLFIFSDLEVEYYNLRHKNYYVNKNGLARKPRKKEWIGARSFLSFSRTHNLSYFYDSIKELHLNAISQFVVRYCH